MKKNPPKECADCDGEGYVVDGGGLGDCRACDGTGYADKQPRMSCAACGWLHKEVNMHVSHDLDGNRTVCEPCMLRIEKFWANGVPTWEKVMDVTGGPKK